jgi:MFS family permease
MRVAPIFVANMFLSLSYATVLYVNSSFLGQFFNRVGVGALFLIAALANILVFLAIPKLLEWFSTRSLFVFILIIICLALVGLIFSTKTVSVAFFFVVYGGLFFTAYYCLDLFLEERTINRRTGGIRGLYLTLQSVAIASAPIFLTIFTPESQFGLIYLVSLSFLIIPIILATIFFKKYAHGAIRVNARTKPMFPIRKWWLNGSLRRATLARLALESFYAVMIIYTPIYLHEIIGFSWAELGIIFPIMLLPFVLLEWPVGVLADRSLGEKEIMSFGFFIAGMALIIMPFLDKIIVTWIVILFLSRVGASLIEISTESHFFKHVNSIDVTFIEIFRLARPVGIILGASIGALTIKVASFEMIYFVLAVIIFVGLIQSIGLKDTK